MTSKDEKGMIPPSKVLEKVLQAKGLGLESLSCVIPKVSNRVDNAATENNSTVFPLKESYSRNIQHPHSQIFWKNSAKDYRHELLNEIAEDEEKRSDNVQVRPTIRRIPDMPPRAHLYHNQDPEREEVEAEYIDTNLEMLEEDEFHEYRDKVATKVLETARLDCPNFPQHDADYNAILNVQEDEDHINRSEMVQSSNDLGNGANVSRLLTDHVFQEYKRLMAICEKHEEKEIAIRKARLNLENQKLQHFAVRRPLCFDRRQRPIESNPFVKNDAVSDSLRSFDTLSVSNLSSPTVADEADGRGIVSSTRSSRGELDQLETRSRLEQARLRRSLSFDSRWESFEKNGFANKDHAVSAAQNTAFLTDSLPSIWARNIGFVPATTQPQRYETELLGSYQQQRKAALPESFPSASYPIKEKPSYLPSTAGALDESVQKKHMRENEFVSKITVVGPQHSLDPIFVARSSSHNTPSNRSNKKTSSPSRNFPKGDGEILKATQTTKEVETLPFDELQEQNIETLFTANETIPESSNSTGPIFVSDSSSSTPLYQERSTVKRAESRSSSQDGFDLPTASEPLRQSATARYGNQFSVAKSSTRSKEKSFLNMQPDGDPSSSQMLWQKKREVSSLSSMHLKNSVTIEERRGINHSSEYVSGIIELNTPAVTPELSFLPSSNIQPITPSPKESENQLFRISPERDVRCDKRIKHQFFEANPYIPAYSDSVIIGRPISPENSNRNGNQEHGSIAGLSPVTCSASQFRNNIFASTNIHSEDDWGDQSVDREPVERSNETIKVQHLSSGREVNPQVPHNPPPLQTCMPLINRKLRSVLDRYNVLKESTRPLQTTHRAEPDGQN